MALITEAHLEELNSDVPLIDKDRKLEKLYSTIFMFSYFHLAGLIGLYDCFTTAKWNTVILVFPLYMMGILGITAGAHRLWAHRTYKAKLPLQVILIVFNSLASQYTAFYWARDHRLHHKFSDTEADPHNSRRGIFFSHIGWLLVKKGKQITKQGSKISMDDLYANKVVMFQNIYGLPIIVTIGFLIPSIVPVYFWGESLWNAWHVNMLRFAITLNSTFMINSYAHAFGSKPYETETQARQNIGLSLATLGESFHNYHHAFPWDYRTAELGNNILNPTTKFIDFFGWIGWAYDFKSASDDMIHAKMLRSGDGTNLWGLKKHEECEKIKKRIE